MNWYHEVWCTRYALPAAAGALVTWLSLFRRFAGRGRLLGTWRSAGLAAAVVGLMAGASVVAGLALPHLAALPPAAAGLVTGFGAAPRRQRDESTQPVVKILSFGVASLLERLEYRLSLDCLDWCERQVEPLTEIAQLWALAEGVTDHLRARQTGRVLKAVQECHQDAAEALDRALAVYGERHEGRRTTARRAFSDPEQRARARVFAEARSRCLDLLALWYRHGRRSEEPALHRIVAAARPPDACRTAPVPVRRRSFPGVLARRR